MGAPNVIQSDTSDHISSPPPQWASPPAACETTKMGRTNLSKKARFEIFKRDGFACKYCGATPNVSPLQVDHIHPVAEGGSSEPDNLITACVPCNQGKGKRTLGDKMVPIGTATEAQREQAEQIRTWAAMQRDVAEAKQEIKSDGVELWEKIVGKRCPPNVAGAMTGLLVEFGYAKLVEALEAVAGKRLYGSEAPYFFGIIRNWRVQGGVPPLPETAKSDSHHPWWFEYTRDAFNKAISISAAIDFTGEPQRLEWLEDRFHDACFWPSPTWLGLGSRGGYDWEYLEFALENGGIEWSCGDIVVAIDGTIEALEFNLSLNRSPRAYDIDCLAKITAMICAAELPLGPVCDPIETKAAMRSGYDIRRIHCTATYLSDLWVDRESPGSNLKELLAFANSWRAANGEPVIEGLS